MCKRSNNSCKNCNMSQKLSLLKRLHKPKISVVISSRAGMTQVTLSFHKLLKKNYTTKNSKICYRHQHKQVSQSNKKVAHLLNMAACKTASKSTKSLRE